MSCMDQWAQQKKVTFEQNIKWCHFETSTLKLLNYSKCFKTVFPKVVLIQTQLLKPHTITKMLLSHDKATNCYKYVFLADMFGILNTFQQLVRTMLNSGSNSRDLHRNPLPELFCYKTFSFLIVNSLCSGNNSESYAQNSFSKNSVFCEEFCLKCLKFSEHKVWF